MKILTVSQMKEAERKSGELEVSGARLMENAGSAAANFIKKTFENIAGRNFMIFCGSGNNGGDGLVVGRKLVSEGANVILILCGGIPKTEEASFMYASAVKAGLTVFDWNEEGEKAKAKEYFSTADVIVDALFGTGFRGALSDEYREITKLINNAIAAVVSLDIPSGVDAKNGEADQDSVRADFTVAFDCRKPGHLLLPGRTFSKKTVDVDIGIPQEVTVSMLQDCFCADDAMVFSSIRRRPLFCHKGVYGRLLAICGSENYPGAAAVCTYAAMRAGAGITTLASTESVIAKVLPRIPEATFLPLPADEEGRIAAASDKLVSELEKSTVCLIGCGLGGGEGIRDLVLTVLKKSEGPVVLDADGLNALSGHPELLLLAKSPVILTPHMGEMARLCGLSIQEIQDDRVEIVRAFAKKYKVVLVLKDASTVTASPNGDVYFNLTGSPALAKGGSGDCLAGIIAAFAAQKMNPTACAVCGVWLHGLAGERAAEKYSSWGVLATDLPEEFCKILAEHGV